LKRVILTYQFPLLASEILQSRKFSAKEVSLNRVVVCLREIGFESLNSALDKDQEQEGFKKLKRVVGLFNQIPADGTISVSDELYALLQEWKVKSKSTGTDPQMFKLIDFLVEESNPAHVLQMLEGWSKHHAFGNKLSSPLQMLLRKGVDVSLQKELSGSLLRMKHARKTYTDDNAALMQELLQQQEEQPTEDIWRNMSMGKLSIDK